MQQMLHGIRPRIRPQKNFVLIRSKNKIRLVSNDFAPGAERPDLRQVFSAVHPTILNAKAEFTGLGSSFDGVDCFLNARHIYAICNDFETLFHSIFLRVGCENFCSPPYKKCKGTATLFSSYSLRMNRLYEWRRWPRLRFFATHEFS